MEAFTESSATLSSNRRPCAETCNWQSIMDVVIHKMNLVLSVLSRPDIEQI